tara:strand:+ start:165288 stop:166877 length:1590 start_codon:yes stop_codon:yes gene_type:complete
VEALYADLLSEDEQGLIDSWRFCSPPAQCLYVRLVSRAGPWFRVDRLDYPEIPDLPEALAELLEKGLLARADALDMDALGPLFTLPEWRRAFADETALPASANKSALLEAVSALDLGDGELQRRLAGSQTIVAPCGAEAVEVLQLLFFGNRRQGLTDFVLSDLGVARYYPYALDRQQRLFASRAALDEYRHFGLLADAAWLLREAGDGEGLAGLGELLLEDWPRHSPSQRRYWRLLNRVARELERHGLLPLAATLYRHSQLHPARERLARTLELSGDPAGALAECEVMLASPWNEAELDAVRRMRPRLLRQLGRPAPPARRDRFDTRDMLLPPCGERVELAAARALEAEWAEVHYVENQLLNGLFGLAFWDVIFAPVAGAFHNAFQAVPADMYEPDFRERRRELLARRLEELRSGDLRAQLLATWDRCEGYQCRWVAWRYLSRDLLARSLDCLPPRVLLAIWERQLFDPAENRRGFPDLLALDERPGEYRFYEVKGPGDQLQDSQRRWLRFFAREGIPAQVLRVSWSDD